MDTIDADMIVLNTLDLANKQLAKLLGSDVIIIKSPMMPPIDDVIRTEIEGLKERNFGKRDKLSVLLETNGGLAETVERVSDVFRRHYQVVNFIVPNYAYSAGTLLVLSGDEIFMDYYSVLGPIDPQYPTESGEYVPGMGYLAKFQELVDKVNGAKEGEEAKVRAEMSLLLKKFDPAKLFHIEQSIAHAKSLLRSWLPKYKFKDWTATETRKIPVQLENRVERADEIAEILGNAQRWHSHGRGISIRELESEEIKLKIKNFGDDPKLNEHVRHYHALFVDYVAKRGIKAAVHSLRGMRKVR